MISVIMRKHNQKNKIWSRYHFVNFFLWFLAFYHIGKFFQKYFVNSYIIIYQVIIDKLRNHQAKLRIDIYNIVKKNNCKAVK